MLLKGHPGIVECIEVSKDGKLDFAGSEKIIKV
jgi:hypothetical protein